MMNLTMTSLVAKRSVFILFLSLFSLSLADNNQWGADRTIRGERDKDIAFPQVTLFLFLKQIQGFGRLRRYLCFSVKVLEVYFKRKILRKIESKCI